MPRRRLRQRLLRLPRGRCQQAPSRMQLPIRRQNMWYDYCFVRYGNTDFAGKADTDAGVILVNVQVEETDPKGFEKAVGMVMGKAAAQASAAGSAGLGRALVEKEASICPL